MSSHTEGSIAVSFADSIAPEFARAGFDATVTDFYVTSSNQVQYGRADLDRIPRNRVFGVTVVAEVNAIQFVLFYDGLEQTVIAKQRTNDAELELGEFYDVAAAVERCCRVLRGPSRNG
jgi:hypothetical protein